MIPNLDTICQAAILGLGIPHKFCYAYPDYLKMRP
jgi:hypothetical protein